VRAAEVPWGVELRSERPGTTTHGVRIEPCARERTNTTRPDRIEAHAVLAIPLRVGGTTLGQLLLARCATPGEYTRQDQHLVEDVARRAAQILQERRVAEREAERRAHTRLVKEASHRVGNNLQVICSLMYLQALRASTPRARRIFEQNQRRVRSIAKVHEALYRTDDLARLDLGAHLRELVASLQASHAPLHPRIETEVLAANAWFDVDVVTPCSLIVNELVSNAFEHAFPGDRRGRIIVSLGREPEGMVRLSVCDDGVGLEGPSPPRDRMALGLDVVCALVDQLGGALVFEPGCGPRIHVMFSPQRTPCEGDAYATGNVK
jgi:two-component sensor histidine kinase